MPLKCIPLQLCVQGIASILIIIYSIGICFFSYFGISLALTSTERRSLPEEHHKYDTEFLKAYDDYLFKDSVAQAVIWIDFILCLAGISFAIILLYGANYIWSIYALVVTLVEIPISVISFVYDESNSTAIILEFVGYTLHFSFLFIVFLFMKEIKTGVSGVGVITTVPYKLTV